MARIHEYTAPTTKITPSTQGLSAYEQAGRRIGPAYNEAANLTDRGARQEYEATNTLTGQQAKLQRALLSQYKDLFDEAQAVKAGKGAGGGGGFHVREPRAGRGAGGGQATDPAAASEVSNGAARLSHTLANSARNPGGLLDPNNPNDYTLDEWKNRRDQQQAAADQAFTKEQAAEDKSRNAWLDASNQAIYQQQDAADRYAEGGDAQGNVTIGGVPAQWSSDVDPNAPPSPGKIGQLWNSLFTPTPAAAAPIDISQAEAGAGF